MLSFVLATVPIQVVLVAVSLASQIAALLLSSSLRFLRRWEPLIAFILTLSTPISLLPLLFAIVVAEFLSASAFLAGVEAEAAIGAYAFLHFLVRFGGSSRSVLSKFAAFFTFTLPIVRELLVPLLPFL